MVLISLPPSPPPSLPPPLLPFFPSFLPSFFPSLLLPFFLVFIFFLSFLKHIFTMQWPYYVQGPVFAWEGKPHILHYRFYKFRARDVNCFGGGCWGWRETDLLIPTYMKTSFFKLLLQADCYSFGRPLPFVEMNRVYFYIHIILFNFMTRLGFTKISILCLF